MKKLLVIAVLGLLLSTNAFAAKKWGNGELKLSPFVTGKFIEYIKGNQSKAPYLFSVSIDGRQYQYYYCGAGLNNCRGGDERILEQCEKYSKGVKCFLFARNRTIKWNNGINPGKGKASIINSKWSDSEIEAKLKELGFLGGETKKIEKKETKKKENKVKDTDANNDVIQQLKDLNEMYKSGALTKEEFEKAKKKILN